MLSLREERMSEAMMKWHIDGLMGSAVIHDFAGPDSGPPHDHPFSARSMILFGSYVEEAFQLDGTVTYNTRNPGDSFIIEAGHIHRIIELPEGRCQTIFLPALHERKSGFYDFREDGAYHRYWDESEWRKIAQPVPE